MRRIACIGCLVVILVSACFLDYGCGSRPESKQVVDKNGPAEPMIGNYVGIIRSGEGETPQVTPGPAMNSVSGMDSSDDTNAVAGTANTPTNREYKSTTDDRPANDSGTVLIEVRPNGSMRIAASDGTFAEAFVGESQSDSDHTFSTTLTSAVGNTSISGTTYSNKIDVALTGAIAPSAEVVASYIGQNNPLVASYAGTISGKGIGSGQTLNLTVTNGETSNVSGSFSGVGAGRLSVNGSVNPVGVFQGTATTGIGNRELQLTGTFTEAIDGQVRGSGSWTDVQDPSNVGTWFVNTSSHRTPVVSAGRN